MNHTPGPWETSVLSGGTQWEICGTDGGDAIASVVECQSAAANARLIAAAPDLLQTLREIADAYDSVQLNPTARVLAAKARATIAKATE